VNSQGPLGLIWAGVGLCAFYIALIWVNTLLPMLLSGLFLIPLTWVMDKVKGTGAGSGAGRPGSH